MGEATLPDDLNTFYARFDILSNESAAKCPTSEGRPLSVSTSDVRRTLLRVNMSKAAGPENIPDRVLRTYAYQQADVLTDIFNISILRKCFDKLVLQHIKNNIPASFDPH